MSVISTGTRFIFCAAASPPNPPPRTTTLCFGSILLAAAQRHAEFPSGVYDETFENLPREKAVHAILTQLGADRSRLLSDNEKRQVRIILYGHSRGGSAMLQLARELNQRGIPVLLTVQV